jgi:DNA polymerase iota
VKSTVDLVMSRYQYFDELSGDSSDDGCSSDDDDADDSEHEGGSLAQRTILHADVDCFYCQCEVLDRKLDPDRPLAIGQKHIVVTCNYAARAQGITKLMDRIEAQRRCPHLLIFEGSDLQRYRIHARKIYDSFRRAIKAVCPNSAVRKGSMDEMMAELSSSDLASLPSFSLQSDGSEDIFLCNQSDKIQWKEDQSGAQSLVAPSHSNYPRDGTKVHENLYFAARWALQIRHTIWKETGFTTTLGVSYNPMLAKLAIGFHKPGTVNLLEPELRGRSSFVESLPLRSVPGIGSRTMKALRPGLEKCHGRKGDPATAPWLCRYVFRFTLKLLFWLWRLNCRFLLSSQ